MINKDLLQKDSIFKPFNVVHKLLYTSPIIFKPKTQTHNTFMICLVQKKEELKNPWSEMEKRKAKTYSLKKRKKFSSHFRVQKYSLPVCFGGRERETVWENYWPLLQAKKKKEILRLFFLVKREKWGFFIWFCVREKRI